MTAPFPNAAPPPESDDAINARDFALQMELAQWAGQQCRICGRELTWEDVSTPGMSVFAGVATTGETAGRAAHARCWRGMAQVARELINSGMFAKVLFHDE